MLTLLIWSSSASRTSISFLPRPSRTIDCVPYKAGGESVSPWQTKLGQLLALRFCLKFKGACVVVKPDEFGETTIEGGIKFASKLELACDGES
jgi:hypothetical protein